MGADVPLALEGWEARPERCQGCGGEDYIHRKVPVLSQHLVRVPVCSVPPGQSLIPSLTQSKYSVMTRGNLLQFMVLAGWEKTHGAFAGSFSGASSFCGSLRGPPFQPLPASQTTPGPSSKCSALPTRPPPQPGQGRKAGAFPLTLTSRQLLDLPRSLSFAIF